jgi:hypothetical protein
MASVAVIHLEMNRRAKLPVSKGLLCPGIKRRSYADCPLVCTPDRSSARVDCSIIAQPDLQIASLFDILQVYWMLGNKFTNNTSFALKLTKNDVSALIREVSDKLCT